MSGVLAKEQAALAKQVGTITKLFLAIKKILAKEFLWILFATVLSLPLALIITYLLKKYAPSTLLDLILQLLPGIPLFIDAFALSIAGIYFTRTVVGAIQTLTKKSS